MPRVTSKKQTRANGKNAALSTGPRTPRGKRRSSMNRLTHGLCARDVVLTMGRAAENPAAFQALLKGLLADFRPASALERGLVERLAACFWRSRRALRLEQSNLFDADAPGDAEAELREELSKKEDDLSNDQCTLRFLEDFRSSSTPPDPSDLLATKAFYKRVLQAAGKLNLKTHDVEAQTLLTKVSEEMEDHIAWLHDHIRATKDDIAVIQGQLSEYDAMAKLGSMPDSESLGSLIRYETANDRQLHRVLNQLLGRRRASMNATLRDLRADAARKTEDPFSEGS